MVKGRPAPVPRQQQTRVGQQVFPAFGSIDVPGRGGGVTLEDRLGFLANPPQPAGREWCLNEYDKPDRQSPGGSARRVVRGGSWLFHRDYARSAYRDVNSPGLRSNNLGLRLVCAAPIA